MSLERQAGRTLDLRELDPLLWELFLIWEGREREHERAHAATVTQIIASLAKAQ
jgi:hypothetical protein